jgi:hypothetical protein
MDKPTLGLLALSVLLGSATLVHAASATCSDEPKACRDRCTGAHKFTGAKLTSCMDQACPGAWGICMHSGYWTIGSTNKKIGPLQKKQVRSHLGIAVEPEIAHDPLDGVRFGRP